MNIGAMIHNDDQHFHSTTCGRQVFLIKMEEMLKIKQTIVEMEKEKRETKIEADKIVKELKS